MHLVLPYQKLTLPTNTGMVREEWMYGAWGVTRREGGSLSVALGGGADTEEHMHPAIAYYTSRAAHARESGVLFHTLLKPL